MADQKYRPEIEVLSAADVRRRRYWDDADKIRIVEESLLGHRQVAATARAPWCVALFANDMSAALS